MCKWYTHTLMAPSWSRNEGLSNRLFRLCEEKLHGKKYQREIRLEQNKTNELICAQLPLNPDFR